MSFLEEQLEKFKKELAATEHDGVDISFENAPTYPVWTPTLTDMEDFDF